MNQILSVLINPLTLVVFVMFVALHLWEQLFPRIKNLPKIKYASLRGILSFIVFLYVSTYFPLLIDGYLAPYQLFDLSHLNVGVQAIVGLMFYQFALYFYHISVHKSTLLWRVCHQMHHSSERLDLPSTYYFSLMDMAGFSLLTSFCFVFFMGLAPTAITIVVFSLNFLSQFQHANIHTPQWLGWIIQRPEQHAIHHERGSHMYNYSDFPIYDYFFGTFRNPKDFRDQYGFYDGASARVVDMLLFKDVSTPKSVTNKQTDEL